MDIIKTISWLLFYSINLILAFYFLLPVIFLLLNFSKKKNVPNISLENKNPQSDTSFAAIVTVHQDTRFIPPLIDSFLKQSYKNFTLYVVADDCDITGLNYSNEHVIIIKPAQPLNSKIKSINYAIENFIKPHQAMIIFDSDNLIHPDYFYNLNYYFKKGFKVVQTHMLSKDTKSVYAKLDSIGHIYYTFIERQAKMKFGLHSAILGLGIALDIALYKDINYNNVIAGFDKKLQSQLAIKVNQIAFAEDAIVYDEKVDDGAALEKQRTRWMYSYFENFQESWKLFKAGIKTLSMGRLLLGTTMLRPPMLLLLLLVTIIIVISLFIKPVLCIIWLIILFIFSLNFVLIIATQSVQKGMLASIVYIPLVIFRQFRSLLKLNAAKSDFLKTEHTKIIYIDEILKNESI